MLGNRAAAGRQGLDDDRQGQVGGLADDPGPTRGPGRLAARPLRLRTRRTHRRGRVRGNAHSRVHTRGITMRATRTTGLLLALVTACISGVSVFVNSYGVKSFHSASTYTTAKNLVAAVILLL